jgi:hypothetical protein
MFNNPPYPQLAEYTDYNRHYTSRGYGQTIIDLDAIMAEIQYRGGIF